MGILMCLGLLMLLGTHMLKRNVHGRPDMEAVGIPGVFTGSVMEDERSLGLVKSAFSKSEPVWTKQVENKTLRYRRYIIDSGLTLWFTEIDERMADVVPVIAREDEKGIHVQVVSPCPQKIPWWKGSFMATTVRQRGFEYMEHIIPFRFNAPDFMMARERYDFPKMCRMRLWCPAEKVLFYDSKEDWQQNRPDQVHLGPIDIRVLALASTKTITLVGQDETVIGIERGEPQESGGQLELYRKDNSNPQAPPVQFTGLVKASRKCSNTLTGIPYHVITVHTYGLAVDIVVPESKVPPDLKENGIIFCHGVLLGQFVYR